MYNRPTLVTIRERILADLEAGIEGADATSRPSNLRVLGTVLAGGIHGLYGYIDWALRQLLPDKAEKEYLERWAKIWGIQRKSATVASGTLTLSGNNGVVVSTGVELQRNDGALFVTTTENTVTEGTVTVSVVAKVAGADGNTPAGATFVLVETIAGLASVATVISPGLVGGVNLERDSDLLYRLLKRISRPPQGGAQYDYEDWALSVAGVTRAFVYPNYLGLGTVAIFVLNDTEENSLPDEGVVAAVQAFVNSVRPVTAEVSVFAPRVLTLNFSLSVQPNTSAVRDAVEAELRDLVFREGQPDTVLRLTHLRAAISNADGEIDYNLYAPSANIVVPKGYQPVVGEIQWV